MFFFVGASALVFFLSVRHRRQRQSASSPASAFFSSVSGSASVFFCQCVSVSSAFGSDPGKSWFWIGLAMEGILKVMIKKVLKKRQKTAKITLSCTFFLGHL